MNLRARLALTGVSILAFACSGETKILADGAGDAGGSAGSAGSVSATAGSGFSGNSTGGSTEIGGSGSVAGSGSLAGSGGASQQPPLEEVEPQAQTSKLDVLFVIDNSAGMAEKQAVLSTSLTSFVRRLTNPRCVDSQGLPVATQPTSGAAACSSGTREFAPVTDMHIGGITTSLGAHGGTVCAAPSAGDDPATTHLDDKAELLGVVRTGLTTWENSGFLSFDAAGNTGLADVGMLTTQLQSMVVAAGEHGCGYEAPLEAMYRFLIDPEPPESIMKVGSVSTSSGVNQELLKERAAFLRPDSSVAVVVMSDENDCSIVDSGVGWLVGSASHMPASTKACATNPNDPCCRSCAQYELSPPAGCEALSADPVCGGAATNSYVTLDSLHDSLNLRCFNHKARFGFDLLNPVERYSVGLTNPQIVSGGSLVNNPLFAARDGKPARSNSLISVSFIVGAPWEDLASDQSRSSGELTYLDAASLEAKQRWPLLVGDRANNVKPSDPLMIESIDPRMGTSPLTNAPIVPATSTNPLANPDNGHEQNVPDQADLQYACIFPLHVPKACSNGDATCECSYSQSGDGSAVTAANSPLCQSPNDGSLGTIQFFAKANPGTRELLVARALGSRATPASVCPKVTSPGTSPSYGYVPALSSLATRIGATLK